MTSPKRIPISAFAPSERVPIEIIQRQAEGFKKVPPLLAELVSPRSYVFILNRHRQIVFASRNVRELIPDKMREQLLGLRPGEAVGCIRANEGEAGCGASEKCRECGALQVILNSLAGRVDLREFTLTRFVGCHQEARQFLALAAPFVQSDETFSIFALTESGDLKGRKSLEQFAQRQARITGSDRPTPGR